MEEKDSGEVQAAMTLSGVSTWWRENVTLAGEDYGTAGAGRVARSTAVGAGVGAVAGGAAAGVNAAMDEPYVDYVSRTVPKAELGPSSQQVFRADHARLLEMVRSRSDDGASAARSMQYLAYLKSLAPGTSNDVLSSLFQTVENHFPQDDQARTALNLIGACLGRNPGRSPYAVTADLVNEFNRTGSFERATQSLAASCKVTPQDLQDTQVKVDVRHTTTMGRFGVAGAVLVGAGAGAVAGAGLGAVTGVLWNAIAREEAPPAP